MKIIRYLGAEIIYYFSYLLPKETFETRIVDHQFSGEAVFSEISPRASGPCAVSDHVFETISLTL